MLAAAIRIDRAVEGNIGRLVAGDDGLGGFLEHLGAERRQLFKPLPAIVEQRPAEGFEAPGHVDLGAAAARLAGQRRQPPGTHDGRIEAGTLAFVDQGGHPANIMQSRNKSRTLNPQPVRDLSGAADLAMVAPHEQSPMTRRQILLALLPPLFFGTGFTVAKPAVTHFPPLFLMLLVYGGIALVLAVTHRDKLKTPPAHDFPHRGFCCHHPGCAVVLGLAPSRHAGHRRQPHSANPDSICGVARLAAHA